MTPQIPFIDLSQRPPRGFRVRLGNFVIMARLPDKGRATLAEKNGEYYTSMDEPLGKCLGFDPEALLIELATGKGDWGMLQWIQANSKTPRALWEIEVWSAFMEKRAPDSDVESLKFFNEYVGKLSKERNDIKTWFEAIELDDCVTFGGKV